MTMTPYDRMPTDDTPTIDAWDPTGPNADDGAWREVTDPGEIARLGAALTAAAGGNVYVADDPTDEVRGAPKGIAAPAPDGWTDDDGYRHAPALLPSDLHRRPVPEVWGDLGVPDPAITFDRGLADSLDIDAAMFDPL